jgi:hypothetical protein
MPAARRASRMASKRANCSGVCGVMKSEAEARCDMRPSNCACGAARTAETISAAAASVPSRPMPLSTFR